MAKVELSPEHFPPAFTRPARSLLLSKSVFNRETFSGPGWGAVQQTSRLQDVLERNTTWGIGDSRIGMTESNWRYRWM